MRTDPDHLSNIRMQREATPALSETTASAEMILKSCLTCVYLNDVKNGVNLFVDPGYTKETGYTQEVLQAMDKEAFSSLVHPEDRQRLARHLLRLEHAADETVLEIEYRFRKSDGRWIWCRCREAVFKRDADGAALQIIGSLQDITRWKKAEAELREFAQRKDESLALLDVLFESAPIGLGFWDTEFRFVRLNESLAAVNGLPIDAHLGRTLEEVVPRLVNVLPAWRRILKTGQPMLNVEISGETPAAPGKVRHWVDNWYPVRLGGRVIGIAATVMDITERKEAEKALQKDHAHMEKQVRKRTAQLESTVKKLKKQVGERKSAQSRFRQLSRVFMDAADPIVIEDLDGTIVDINREAEHIYGWKRKELIGKPLKVLLPSDEHEKTDQLRRQCRNGDEVRHWEGLRQDRHGRIFSVLITAFPLINGRGRPVALATIAKDISDLKQMETKLKDSQKRLQDFSRKSIEALESDRQSVAKEIHDSIGASLAAIKFGLEGLLPDLENDPERARKKLETTISHLVDTIKETKQISASLRPTTLDDLGLLATIDWYFRRFNERYPDIELTRRIDLRENEIPEPHKIVIYRILQEALNNAAKHSGADRVIIRLRRKGGQIQLEIEDNGSGFDVCNALHREDPFSGHGLANMKERTDLCGGSFLLFSRPGEGTRITATLSSEGKIQ